MEKKGQKHERIGRREKRTESWMQQLNVGSMADRTLALINACNCPF